IRSADCDARRAGSRMRPRLCSRPQSSRRVAHRAVEFVRLRRQQHEPRAAGSRVTAQRPSSVSVAVTGIGIVSPIGVGRAAFWQALSEGRSGVAPLEGWARPSGLPRVAAAVGEFGAKELITSPQLRRMARLSRMAVAGSRLALRDAQIAVDDLAAERVGVVFGTALGNLRESIGHLDRILTRGPAAASSPMVFPTLVMNAAAGYIAMEFGFTGVNVTVAQAEVSGEHAVALGCEVLQSGRADLVLGRGARGGAPAMGGAPTSPRAAASCSARAPPCSCSSRSRRRRRARRRSTRSSTTALALRFPARPT